MEEFNLNYSERMKERQRIVLEIDFKKSEIEKLNKKINNLEKELKNWKIEKENLEETMNKLKEEYISNGIPVPSEGEYEIGNGLLGVKRDLNLKLIKDLEDKEIEQV
jgi:predicted RNase H-like nuclease (RuvC/YqgF family)